MTPRVVGDPRDLALAGLPDDPGSAGPPAVHLREPDDGFAPGDVLWLAGPATGSVPSGARLIATAGEGLWSRAPWPAHDDLFALPPAPEPSVLIVGIDAERRRIVIDKLAARGRPAFGADQLTVEDLRRASVVALLGEADAATPEQPWRAEALPGEAPAVLAARRLLIAPRCTTTFGLLPGNDHLAFGAEDDVVAYADAALTFPASFEPLIALGALTAERHRASVVYARLA
jgi:hypothetical protein